MRSIFAKIFWWFWLAISLVAASVMAISLASGSQPFGQRWLSQSLDLYAVSAVDFYTHGGKPALQKYLDDIHASAGINATLIDPLGRNILDRPIPPAAEAVFARARDAGQSRFRVRLLWTGASVVPAKDGNYYLVAQISPTREPFAQPSASAALLKLAVAILAAGLLSLLLARHIAAPIHTLQQAAGRIAGGDLSVRATPAIPPRNDELADLARDFDRMAERIQSLLSKHQELLGDISHELRSPLTRMSVSLELARRGEAIGLDRMQSEIDKLDALIGQILTLTRLQFQQELPSTSPVNLRTLIESIAEDARFEGRHENKSVTFSPASDVWVSGDPALLRSAIENVVRNAVRYSKPGTAVEITLRLVPTATAAPAHSSPAACVLVEDCGEGVPEASLPKLFEAFYRVSGARDRSTGGTGLGLSIAQKVVQWHQGTIVARNRQGGGLVMEITLPANQLTANSQK